MVTFLTLPLRKSQHSASNPPPTRRRKTNHGTRATEHLKCGHNPDDVFELVEEQERLLLDVLTAGVQIGALVGGQVLDQPFTQGPERPAPPWACRSACAGWAGWIEILNRVQTAVTCA